MLKHILAFIKEADLGVTVFEKDSTFQDFAHVVLKSDGTIKRQPCD